MSLRDKQVGGTEFQKDLIRTPNLPSSPPHLFISSLCSSVET